MIFEKSCGAIVYTVDNGVIKYLLVEENSGFHSFPKGRMENEETEEQTAIREIKEETDLEVELITDFKVCEQYNPAEKPGFTKQVVYFLAHYSDAKPRVTRPNEVMSLKSLSLEDSLITIEHENKKELLKQADEYIKHKIVSMESQLNRDLLGGTNMKCPYCKNEMEQGFIQSPQEISWKKGDKRPFLGRAQFHEGSVILSELSLMKGSAVAAFLCRDCKKVIIDFSDENADFNQR